MDALFFSSLLAVTFKQVVHSVLAGNDPVARHANDW